MYEVLPKSLNAQKVLVVLIPISIVTFVVSLRIQSVLKRYPLSSNYILGNAIEIVTGGWVREGGCFLKVGNWIMVEQSIVVIPLRLQNILLVVGSL